MIEVSGLTKRYGDTVALSDVTFKVEKGQIVGFLGANGAGKTTTMDILCGCSSPDHGVIKINGVDVTEEPAFAKLHLGYLPDEPPLYTDMRVSEYIEYAACIHKVPGKDVKARVDSIIDRLALGEVRNRIVGNLSKGFKQRVGLAQALVHEPKVLVLDEPTEGLDPNQIVQIRELIRSFAGKHTILLSSHILSEVQNTCDHIIIIHEGKIIEQGTYEELVKKVAIGGRYKLVVAQDADRLAKELASIKGVFGVELNPSVENRIEFQTDSPDVVLDNVARKVLDGKFGFKELTPTAKSLEEIFFQLTT